jgi:hypothetical protein
LMRAKRLQTTQERHSVQPNICGNSQGRVTYGLPKSDPGIYSDTNRLGIRGMTKMCAINLPTLPQTFPFLTLLCFFPAHIPCR